MTRREIGIGLAVTEIEKIAAQKRTIYTTTLNFYDRPKMELETQKVVKHILLIIISL